MLKRYYALTFSESTFLKQAELLLVLHLRNSNAKKKTDNHVALDLCKEKIPNVLEAEGKGDGPVIL